VKPQLKNVQDFHELREECLKTGELFVDSEFDTVDSSLFYNDSDSRDYRSITWLRPHVRVLQRVYYSVLVFFYFAYLLFIYKFFYRSVVS